MKENQTIAQFLNVKEFPFEIKDKNGNRIYLESCNNTWEKTEYDSDGNVIYYEFSNGNWYKREFDSDGKEIYFESSDGYWEKREFDSDGKEIYYENSEGKIRYNRPKDNILSMEDIAKKINVDIKNLKIKQ